MMKFESVFFSFMLLLSFSCKDDKTEVITPSDLKMSYTLNGLSRQYQSSDTINVALGDSISLHLDYTGKSWNAYYDMNNCLVRSSDSTNITIRPLKIGDLSLLMARLYYNGKTTDEQSYDINLNVSTHSEHFYAVYPKPYYFVDVEDETLKQTIESQLSDSTLENKDFVLKYTSVSGGTLSITSTKDNSKSIGGTFVSDLYNMKNLTLNYNGTEHNYVITRKTDADKGSYNYLLVEDLTSMYQSKYPTQNVGKVIMYTPVYWFNTSVVQ